MTTAARLAARERLLDAELATVLRGKAALARPRRSRWAAAAILLGVLATASTALLHRSLRLAQDPQAITVPPLPPEWIHTDSRAELDLVPADAVALHCKLSRPEDLALLQRLTALRQLSIAPIGARIGGKTVFQDRSWQELAPDWLAPLTALPMLESLRLPGSLSVDAKHLAALATAPKLHELTLGGTEVRIDDALARAMASLPQLRSLVLMQTPVDVAQIRALQHCPLRELTLWGNDGVDEAVIGASSALRHLRSLKLCDFGAPPLDPAQAATWRPTAAAIASLGTLPELRTLAFAGSAVDDDVLAAIPATITRLELYSTSGYTAAGLRGLRRLAGLRSLRLRERHGYALFDQHRIAPHELAGALVDLLGTVCLQHLDFTGWPTPELLAALAAQPDLHSLTLFRAAETSPPPLPDFELLASAPRLATLRLLSLKVAAEDLAPLAACKSLRRVDLLYCHVDPDAIRKLLPGVTLEIRELAPPKPR